MVKCHSNINQLPPPKRLKLPPKKLPVGKFVLVLRSHDGYMVATTRTRSIVGARLDKGRGIYPTCKTRGMELPEAVQSFALWETFCAQQTTKNT